MDVLEHQELASDEETGSETSRSSHLSNVEECEVEAKFEEFTEKKLKPDFSHDSRVWLANCSKPSIHVSLMIEDESGNVSVESHDLYEDKEMTNEIQMVTEVTASGSEEVKNETKGRISPSTPGDDELGESIVFKRNRGPHKDGMIKLARKNGIIRNISDSDDEEEQFDHVMSLLSSQMEPQPFDHLSKSGQFLTAMRIDTDSHTDTEQIEEEED